MENIIGKQILKLRNSRGYTQEDLALKLGVSKQTVSNWETGLKSPRMGAIQKMAEMFNVNKSFIIDGIEDIPASSIETIYNQLDPPRKAKVYNFAEYQLKEQNKKPQLTIVIKGYVSAGKGEWLEEATEEVEYTGEVPPHDFAVKVNGDSMLPLFENGQVIFVKGTSEARDGQIIICKIGSDAFVKKLSGQKLVSLNKEYEDIPISDIDDFKIFGVVVL